MNVRINNIKTLFLSETARNTYAIFMGNLLSAVFSFVFTVTLVRILSLADFGYFSALLSLMMLVVELADIGIGQSLSSFLPPLAQFPEKINDFLKAAFSAQSVIILFISGLLAVFGKQMSVILFHTPGYSFLVVLTSVSIFCSTLANFTNYSLSARKKFFNVGFLTMLGSLLRLIFLFVVLILTKASLENTVLAQTLSLVLLLFVSLYMINFNLVESKAKITDVKKLLRFAYLLGAARMFTAIAYRLDVLMLVSLKNATEAGIYSTASRVIALYPLLTGSFLIVIAPKIASISDKRQLHEFLKKIIFGTSILVVSAVLMILIAYPFMTVLFGNKVAPAVPVFRLLLFSIIFFIASIPAVALAIYYLKKPYILTVNGFVQLVIVVFGNFIFIPEYGRLGPAYSLIAAYASTFVLTVIMTTVEYRRKLKV